MSEAEGPACRWPKGQKEFMEQKGEWGPQRVMGNEVGEWEEPDLWAFMIVRHAFPCCGF